MIRFYSGARLCWRRIFPVSLASFWCLGLLLGGVAAAGTGSGFAVSLYRCARQSVPMLRLIVLLLLPFLFSAFAVSLSQPWLTLPICFAKAFLVSFCACACMHSFGSAGWLICMLLMFSDGCLLPLLCWFWLRHGDGTRQALARDTAACAVVTILVGSLDASLIAPFLASIL